MGYTIDMRFLDTNVLLYSISGTPAESWKRNIAREILDSPDLGLSTQVLQEFVVQATRPTRSDRIEMEDAVELIESWLRYPVQETTVELVTRAARTAERWRVSYWDAAIIEAARLLGCRRVMSEDLKHGQTFDGITVVNPFRDGPEPRFNKNA
jgi:predicted nucleic acid-binding protein